MRDFDLAYDRFGSLSTFSVRSASNSDQIIASQRNVARQQRPRLVGLLPRYRGHATRRGSGLGQKPAFDMYWHMWVVLIAGPTGYLPVC